MQLEFDDHVLYERGAETARGEDMTASEARSFLRQRWGWNAAKMFPCVTVPEDDPWARGYVETLASIIGLPCAVKEVSVDVATQPWSSKKGRRFGSRGRKMNAGLATTTVPAVTPPHTSDPASLDFRGALVYTQGMNQEVQQ